MRALDRARSHPGSARAGVGREPCDGHAVFVVPGARRRCRGSWACTSCRRLPCVTIPVECAARWRSKRKSAGLDRAPNSASAAPMYGRMARASLGSGGTPRHQTEPLLTRNAIAAGLPPKRPDHPREKPTRNIALARLTAGYPRWHDRSPLRRPKARIEARRTRRYASVFITKAAKGH
jgi:hypothetical protein